MQVSKNYKNRAVLKAKDCYTPPNIYLAFVKCLVHEHEDEFSDTFLKNQSRVELATLEGFIASFDCLLLRTKLEYTEYTPDDYENTRKNN